MWNFYLTKGPDNEQNQSIERLQKKLIKLNDDSYFASLQHDLIKINNDTFLKDLISCQKTIDYY